MITRRGSGILLHPTSLPGPYGIGDFGPEAYKFVDCLASAAQIFWQLLPLGPPGKGNSPYNCLSAFAGNPLLISPERLVESGYLTRSEISQPPEFSSANIDFPAAQTYKDALLRKAFARFEGTVDYRAFEEKNAGWLEPFAQFMALKLASGEIPWTDPGIMTEPDPDEIKFHKFVQYEFSRQWFELREHCREQGIAVIGDVPFYVAHDSSDVWANRDIFLLDEKGNSTVVGGVPPDYFSITGQLWGNPMYRWDRLQETGYRWWIDRLRASLNLFDMVRLDHFRGFEAAWEVPAGSETAVEGRWAPGPGAKLFEVAARDIGVLPFVAENLGVITPPVEDIRSRFGFPGMAVLQFGFGPDSPHRPDHYSPDTLACTGTHDNDTIVGWWNNLRDRSESSGSGELIAERECVLQFIKPGRDGVHWDFIRAVMASAANIVITPLQDVLGLGSDCRMNVPGTSDGNWRWRYESESISPDIISKLRALTELTSR